MDEFFLIPLHKQHMIFQKQSFFLFFEEELEGHKNGQLLRSCDTPEDYGRNMGKNYNFLFFLRIADKISYLTVLSYL